MSKQRSISKQNITNERMMRRALSLAKRGQGRVEPNPMVGCVIAKGGRIIGEGYHRRFGAAHAEARALANCTQNPKNSTVYVTLEPCRHFGKTPPCADALIQAGVKEVFYAVADPCPAVSGGGARVLKKAGVTVHEGLCSKESAEILAPFLTFVKKHRPYVIAKWAQSLDGKLATRSGDSQWISCEESRRRVHLLRARVDAILVGTDTLLADNPTLTARDVTIKRTAMRVVLDRQLRIGMKSQLVKTAEQSPVYVFTDTTLAKTTKANQLRKRGVFVESCKCKNSLIVLADLLDRLHSLDVTNLMVEGGSALHTSMLRANLVDEAHVFVAPILIGGKTAPGPLHDQGPARMAQAIRPEVVATKRSGVDTFYQLRFTDPPQ